ncbi:MAG: serine/threonine-protein kinase RsbW [Thermoleophilaceae bacterium]|jgi:anti-sigma regulatory factor (Ser/Thr protein kinase)|nr:serine/threonine-protein kinase RsbW [Thermoleophilaceae bacterium]
MIDIKIELGRPGLKLGLPADAQNLPVIRQAFKAFGQIAGLPDDALGDAELAITEAASNVVKHAYPDDAEGTMTVDLRSSDGTLTATVTDHGRGIPANVLSNGRGEQGFGLVLMSGTALELGISSSEDGTQVTMAFDAPLTGPEGRRSAGAELILRRIVAVLGAQADLSFDRLTEAVMAGELLAVHSPARLDGDVLEIQADNSPGVVELSSGPYRAGQGDSVVADTEAPVIGRVLEKLCNRIDLLHEADGTERLKLRLEAS